MTKGRLGISSYAYVHACRAGLTIPQLIDKALAHHVTVVQIGDNICWDRFFEAELCEAGEYAEQHNITLETGFRGLLPEKTDDYLRITRILNAKLMRIVIDAPGFRPDLPAVIDILSHMVPALEAYGITVGIENHDRFFSDEFAYIVKSLNHPQAAMVLDAANASGKEETLDHVLEQLAPYTACFHAKNYRIIRRTIGMGFEIVGAKMADGNLQVEKIIEYLNRHSPYPFNTILELWCDAQDTVEQSLLTEEEWVTEGLNFLKKFAK